MQSKLTLFPSPEELLSNLFSWDTTVDEIYAFPEDDPNFDEDSALEAYEEMIHVVTKPDGTNETALCLAVQLLTKHFYKFPHVHLNVVDAMVALCDRNRPVAVRLHAIRSFLEIVRASNHEKELVEQCRQRVTECIDRLLAKEASAGIRRHVELVKKALTAEPKAAKRTTSKENTQRKANTKETVREKTREQEKPATSNDKKDNGRREKTSKDDRRNPEDREKPSRDERKATGTRDERERERRPSAASDMGAFANSNGQSCPPGPYIFVGGVPRGTMNSDISSFLSAVDPALTSSAVQIKFPKPNAAGYAFVSLSSTRHALEAIRRIKSTEFNGRNLIGDFARGPPCSTLLFLERNGTKSMYEEDAVRDADFASKPSSVWDDLCDELRRYGSMELVSQGKVRFRDPESAKAVIRRHHIVIQNQEFFPVYDPEEQAANDGNRRRRADADSRDNHGRKRQRSRSPERANDRVRPRREDDRDHPRRSSSRDRSVPRSRPEGNRSRYGPSDGDLTKNRERDSVVNDGNRPDREDRGRSRQQRDQWNDRASRDQRENKERESGRSASPRRDVPMRKDGNQGRRSVSPTREGPSNKNDRAPRDHGRSASPPRDKPESRPRDSGTKRSSRKTDDRSIAEIAREQQERQRQQQQQRGRGRDREENNKYKGGAPRSDDRYGPRDRGVARSRSQSNPRSPPRRRDSVDQRGRGRSPTVGSSPRSGQNRERSRSLTRMNGNSTSSRGNASSDRRRAPERERGRARESKRDESPNLRLRSRTPSPVRRDHKHTSPRRRASSEDRDGGSDDERRVNRVTSRDYEEMDELMVDYEEDDD
ncbi:hypothetical protein Poli38472_013315 [Pythium oligandrum]|uniref:RRM domain-containing protein n=1 Tax=Pythium oligandrum TaxID=41045 RepID=A0A8K1FD16_PYTOL|nr:hypothetical protein Poli38472_013315 [Pythium oligandrum]|eukprot:TMW57841.1 hypothetical protein Poli38472_013315 [Pythium oligandrum]